MKTDFSVDTFINLINASGMSLTQIAEKSGVSRRTIYNWLHNKATPSIDTAQWVLTAIGYDLKITEVQDEVRKNE